MDRSTLDWPFFDDSHRRLAATLARWARRAGAAPLLGARGRRWRCRAAGGPAGEPAGSAPCGAGTAHGGLHPRLDVRSALPGPRDAGLARRARRLRLRHAGAGSGADHPVRERAPEAPLPAAGGEGRGDRRLRAVGAGGGLRRRGDEHAARGRRRLCPPRRRSRPGFRTAASPTITWCSRAPARRRAPRGCRPSWWMPTAPGLIDCGAHRGDRAASARDPALRGVPGAGPAHRRSPAMASRSRWRRSTSSARPSARRRWASRGGRWTRRLERATTPQLFGAPLADLQLTQAAIADSATEIDAAALLVYRGRLDQRDELGGARHARGGDGQDVCDRSGAAGDRPRGADCSAARRDRAA